MTMDARSRTETDLLREKEPVNPAFSRYTAVGTPPRGVDLMSNPPGDTALDENAGPDSGPLRVAPDLGDLVRLLTDLPEGQRQALVSLIRAAGMTTEDFEVLAKD